EVMKLEIEVFQNNHTWDLVPLPTEKKSIGCRWMYKVKYKANGDIERFKKGNETKKTLPKFL
ncbi:MAG: hypothetical protein Q8834_02810, partial [Candidatus Phytoplasma australasiaticum]|nr:hypothetical protein [Candidatus Phytoplasma australasiaticum]